jgi:hypothetical protein
MRADSLQSISDPPHGSADMALRKHSDAGFMVKISFQYFLRRNRSADGIVRE